MTAVRLTAKQARALGVVGPGKRVARPARKRKPAAPSRLEETFALLWRKDGGAVVTVRELLTADAALPCTLVREHRFHKDRDWRFDFACLRSQVAIEIEGGVARGRDGKLRAFGRHTTGQGFTDDCKKYNAAALAGWFVIRLTGEMITPENLRAIREVLV